MMNFYRCFIPHAIDVQAPLFKMITGNIKNDNTPPEWTPLTDSKFNTCKQQLANCALPAHPSPHTELSLWVDASNTSAGAVLQQVNDSKIEPLGFFSHKFSAAETRYSTYDRELTAIYLAVRQFMHLLEGRACHIYTDHKPLTFAFQQKLEKASDCQARQLDFISQITTDIRHIEGSKNIVADVLSRIHQIDSEVIDFDLLADDQDIDNELHSLLNLKTFHSSLQ